MRLHALLPFLVLSLAPSCKKKSNAAAEAMAMMAEFTDKMCACKDHPCAIKLQEDMTRWSQEMVRSAGNKRPQPMPEADQKRYMEMATRMAECAQQAMGATSEPPKADPPPPSPPKITNADALLKYTFENLGGHAVKKLLISYVRADGAIDETYGVATVDLGKSPPPAPADDPGRPIGAPLPAAPPTYATIERCPSFTWKRGFRSEDTTPCAMHDAQGIARPKCSVVEVWKRAIDQGAPANALAVLELSGPPVQTWRFSIEDAPRKIHVALEIEDTCEPTLEAPR